MHCSYAGARHPGYAAAVSHSRVPVAISFARFAVCSTLCACAAGGAQAQAYPGKVIRLVIASAPGGGSDLVGRTLAGKLGPAFGQQVVVDNRPGAGGRIGAEVVAKAAPDGYTLLSSSLTTYVWNPILYKNLPYDVGRDFAPISLTGRFEFALVANPSFPATSLAQF